MEIVDFLIKDKKKFDYALWNADSNFSAEEYNEWIASSVQCLKEIYKMKKLEEQSEYQYILGDIINLLMILRVRVKSEIR